MCVCVCVCTCVCVCMCVCVGAEGGELGGDDVDIESSDTSTWAGTDRDYTYEEVGKRNG